MRPGEATLYKPFRINSVVEFIERFVPTRKHYSGTDTSCLLDKNCHRQLTYYVSMIDPSERIGRDAEGVSSIERSPGNVMAALP